MGSLLKGGSKTTRSSSSSQNWLQIPQYLQQPLEDLGSKVVDLSMAPYTPYTGTRFADFNADQLAAFQGIREGQGSYIPFLDQAYGMAQQSGQGITPDMIQQFMNPYQQNVTDIAKREAMRNFDTQMNAVGDQAIAAGAFGGDRHGVVEAEAYRGLNQQLNDLQMQGSQQGYNTALQTALQNAGLMQSGSALMANLAGQNQQLGLTDLAALQQIGGQQQAQAQLPLDFNYQQFQEEKQWPYFTSNFGLQGLSGLAQLQGTQMGTQESVSKESSKMSPLQAAMAIGSMVAAPFTGGASMMGTMGSMFGGGSFGSGLASLVNGAGRGGAMGPFQTPNMFGRYTKGGLVSSEEDEENPKSKNYLKDIIKYIQENPSDVLTGVGTAATMAPYVGPAARGVGGLLSLLKAGKIALPSAKALLTAGGAGTILGAQLGKEEEAADEMPIDAAAMNEEQDIGNMFLGAYDPETFGQVQLDSAEDLASVEGQTRDLLKQKINKFAQDNKLPLIFENPEGDIQDTSGVTTEDAPVAAPDQPRTPSVSSGEVSMADLAGSKKKDWTDNLNLPLLAMGAAILKNPVDQPAGAALGAGIAAFAEMKMAQSKAEMDSRQNSFENMLKMINSQQYARQNDIAEKRFAYEERMQPFETEKTMAQVAKLQAEANEMQDPVSQAVVDTITKQMETNPYMYKTPEDINKAKVELTQKYRLLMDAQGSGDTSLQNLVEYDIHGKRK